MSDDGKTCEAAAEIGGGDNGGGELENENGDSSNDESEGEEDGNEGNRSEDEEEDGLNNIGEIKLQTSFFSVKTLETSFKFDHFLDNLEDLKSKTKLKIKEEGREDHIDISQYSLELRKTDKSYLVLKISEKEPNLQESSINNAEIILIFDQKSLLTSNSNQRRAQYPEDRLSYRPVSFQKLSLFDSNKEVKKASSIGMAIATGTIIITAPFLGSFMIKLPQFFDFLDFININFPSNLAKFLETFDEPFIRMLGQLLIQILSKFSRELGAWLNGEKVKTVEAEVGCFADEKVQENNMGCFLLGNAMGFFVKICFITLLKIILSLITWCVYKKDKKKNSTFGKIFNYANKKISLNFYCSLFIALQMDLLLISFINFRNFYIKETSIGLISSLMSIAVVGFYSTLIIYLVLKTNQIAKKGAKKDKNWGFLIQNYKDFDNEKGIWRTAISHFQNLINIRDFIFPLSVIAFLEYGKIQITILLLIYTTTVIIACLSLPYKRKMENFMLVFLEISCLVILVFLAVLLGKQDDWDEDQKAKFIGSPLIWIISIIIAIIILSSVYESTKSVILFCSSRNAKNKISRKSKKIDKNLGRNGRRYNSITSMFSSRRRPRVSARSFGVSRKRVRRARNTFRMKLNRDKRIIKDNAKIGLGREGRKDQSNPQRK